MSAILSEDAHLRVFAAEPPLPATTAKLVSAALAKLLRQFEREGRCTQGAVWTEQEGRFVLLAWEGPHLSGCSHDKVAQVVQAAERAHGIDMLASLPIAVDQPPRLLTRAGVRAGLESGVLTSESRWWPLRAETVGEWRKGPFTLRDSGLPMGTRPATP